MTKFFLALLLALALTAPAHAELRRFSTFGTYTPTLSNTTNVAASTAYATGYYRIGQVVCAYGKVDVDPTATNTSTVLGVSLPVTSDIAAAQDCGGSANANNVGLGSTPGVFGDETNNRASFQWLTSDIANRTINFHFCCQIK
jgi:hypothetical protein